MSQFVSANSIAEVAALIGDPARANILMALMGGKALTAGELAYAAGVTPQTASGHLAKLREAGLLAQEKQGRHRYFRLASEQTAQVIESLSSLSTLSPPRHRTTGPRDQAMRAARTCYDHMAGALAVALCDRMTDNGWIVLGEGAVSVTDSGAGAMSDWGLDLETPSRRPLCRACLDWSERRHHVAGRLGSAILNRSLELGWVAPQKDSRALRLTPLGARGFHDIFGLRPA